MLSWQDLKYCFDIKKSFRDIYVRPEGRFEPLDGVRAFSIIWVMLFHCFLGLGTHLPAAHVALLLDETPWYLRWISKGDSGVDVFFVLSGFLIGHILMSEIKRSGTIDLRRFYIRRSLRIFPVYWSLVFVVAITTLSQANFRPSTFFINLLYVQNFFPGDLTYIPVSWSLAIEEQFYVLFPLLLIAVVFRFRHRGVVLVGLFVFATLIRIWVLDAHPAIHQADFQDLVFWNRANYEVGYIDRLYVNLHTRFGSLVAGALAAYLTTYHAERLKSALSRHAFNTSLLIVCLCGLIAVNALPLYAPETAISEAQRHAYLAFYRNGSSLLYAIVFLLVMNASGASKVLGRFLALRLWFPIAQLSYSMYLVHISLLATVTTKVLGFVPVQDIRIEHTILIAMLGLAYCMVACAFLFVFVERPFMNYRALLDRRRSEAEEERAAA